MSASASSGLAVDFTSTTPAVCTVADGSFRLQSAGTCTIRANQPGDVTYSAAPFVERSFEVAKAEQTITLGDPGPLTYGDAPAAAVAASSIVELSTLLSAGPDTVCGVASGQIVITGAGTCTIEATQAGDERYLPATTTRTIEIAPKPLSLVGQRVYDGTPTVAAESLQIEGLVEPDALGLSGVAVVNTPDVGEGVALDIDSVSLLDGPSGSGLASNYTLAGGHHRIDTLPRRVLGRFSVSNRDYDGSTLIDSDLITARSLHAVEGWESSTGVVDGDDVLLIGGTAELEDPSAGSDATVRLGGAWLYGQHAGNYVLDEVAPATVDIGRRRVRVGGSFTVADRVYDGSADALVVNDQLSLVDVVAGDDVALVPVAGFDHAGAGDGKAVRLTAASMLEGELADNYVLDLGGAPVSSASITPRPVTVGGSFTVADRVYDGSVDATIVDAELSLVDVVAGDGVGLVPVAGFDDAGAGDGKAVRLTAASMLEGESADNYVLDLGHAPVSSASITPRPVTVALVDGLERVYDGTLEMTVSPDQVVIDGVLESESISSASLSGEVDDATVGARTLTISAPVFVAGANTDLANYDLPDEVFGPVQINPRPLGLAGLTISPRVYDGTAIMAIEAVELVGVVVRDDVRDDVAVAPGSDAIAASVSAGETSATTRISIVGDDAGNYEVVQDTIDVEILALELTVEDAVVETRAYDTTQQVVISGARLVGVLDGDDVELVGADRGLLVSPDVGTHRVVTSMDLAGVAASNYSLVQPELEGTVTPRVVALNFAGDRVVKATGAPMPMAVETSPAGVPVEVTYAGSENPPKLPGSYRVTASVTDSNHVPVSISAMMTILGSSQPQTSGSVLMPAPGGGTQVVPSGQIGPLVYLVGDADRPVPQLMPWIDLGGGHNIVTTPVGSSAVVVLVDGDRVDATRTIEDERRVSVSGPGFGLSVESRTSDGEAISVDPDGSIRALQGARFHISGSGYEPDSRVEVWLFSAPFFIGYATANADGAFESSFPVPAVVELGAHSVQINGFDADGQVRSISLGLVVDAAPVVAPESPVAAPEAPVVPPESAVAAPEAPVVAPEAPATERPAPAMNPADGVSGSLNGAPAGDARIATIDPVVEILPQIVLKAPSEASKRSRGISAASTLGPVPESQLAWGVLLAGVLALAVLVSWRVQVARPRIPRPAPAVRQSTPRREHHRPRHIRTSDRQPSSSMTHSASFRQHR